MSNFMDADSRSSSARITRRGADPRFAGQRVTVDLDALCANHRHFAQLSGHAETGAAVKANGYGLGATQVATALARAGCRSFFTALPEEGIRLRRALQDALADEKPDGRPDIYVLNGPAGGREAAAAMVEADLIPVLNSPEQMECWRDYLSRRGTLRACALHVDTGMNRLGLTAAQFEAARDAFAPLGPTLVMSHLACADEPDHPLNAQQLKRFAALRSRVPGLRASLCNSSGHYLGQDYIFDLTRPGIGLYGGACIIGAENRLRPVATVEARIAMLRDVKKGETIGYGASCKADRAMRVAIVCCGYADGFHRAGSGSGVPLRETIGEGAAVAISGKRAPLLGRVSMDLIAVDASAVDETELEQAEWAEIFGPTISLDEAARQSGTVSYERLTALDTSAHSRAAVTYLHQSAGGVA